MVSVDMSAYKNLYLETSREFIESLKKNLQLLNENPTNKEAIYEVFRSYHSLKSQNHAMGYLKTADLCKLLEDYFHEINDGKRSYAANLQPMISESINMIEQSINKIEINNRETNLTEYSDKLKKTLYANTLN